MKQYDRDYINMIYLLEHKPSGYFGEKSISKLRCFLDGFSFGYSYPKFTPFINEFQEYIEEKYNCNNNSWNNILLKYSNNDEEKALALFFEEFHQFLKDNGIKEPSIHE